jgi:hypothetical protein
MIAFPQLIISKNSTLLDSIRLAARSNKGLTTFDWNGICLEQGLCDTRSKVSSPSKSSYHCTVQNSSHYLGGSPIQGWNV